MFQSPFTLKARKAGYPTFIDFSKEDFEYTVAGPVTMRSFIRADRETVMNFMRGLADGMDYYRDEKNKDRVIKFLGEYYRSNNAEELEETRRTYSQVTPGLPLITVKALENVIANDKNLSGMKLNASELLDLSFLEQLAQERKAKGGNRLTRSSRSNRSSSSVHSARRNKFVSPTEAGEDQRGDLTVRLRCGRIRSELRQLERHG